MGTIVFRSPLGERVLKKTVAELVGCSLRKAFKLGSISLNWRLLNAAGWLVIDRFKCSITCANRFKGWSSNTSALSHQTTIRWLNADVFEDHPLKRLASNRTFETVY